MKGNCTHMWYPHQKSVSMFNCPFLNDSVVGKSILFQIQLVLPCFNFWNSLLTCIFLRTCLQCFGQKVIQHQRVFWPDHPKTEESFGQTIKNQKTQSAFWGYIFALSTNLMSSSEVPSQENSKSGLTSKITFGTKESFG